MASSNNFSSLMPNFKERYSKALEAKPLPDANLPTLIQEPQKIKQIQPQNILSHRFNLLKQYLKPVKY